MVPNPVAAATTAARTCTRLSLVILSFLGVGPVSGGRGLSLPFLVLEGFFDGLFEALFVADVVVILGVLYLAVFDHEKAGHPLDVVFGDQLSGRVEEHGVGDVVVVGGAVDVDRGEGGPV